MKEYDSSDEQEKQEAGQIDYSKYQEFMKEAGRILWKLMNESRYVLVFIDIVGSHDEHFGEILVDTGQASR